MKRTLMFLMAVFPLCTGCMMPGGYMGPGFHFETRVSIGVVTRTVVVHHHYCSYTPSRPHHDVWPKGYNKDSNTSARPAIIKTGRVNLMRPVPGWITQGLHGKYHNAVDFHAPCGTPVLAAADGIVKSAKWSNESGNMIVISHKNGVETVYCHLNRFQVGQGQLVRQGQVIAQSGETGWHCFGAHLHFDVHGEPNPFGYNTESYAQR